MKEYEAKCMICGMVMNKYWMNRMETGRKVQYVCPGCYKKADREIDFWQNRMKRKQKMKGYQ